MGCQESVPANSPQYDTGEGVRLKGPIKFSQEKPSSLESKIVVLGDSAVGKSSLALRFVQGRFPQTHEVTIGAAFLQQTVRVSDGVPHVLHIWDTGGQERFRSMAPLYYRDAAAALVVYDCSDPTTFESVRFWIEELRSFGPKDVYIVVVANKCDIPADAIKVPFVDAKNFCDSKKIRFVEASALTGQNVVKIFEEISEQIYQKRKQQK